MTQTEVETLYAKCALARQAAFVYADRVGALVSSRALCEDRDVLVDAIGGPGLRVPDVRAHAREVHAAGGRLLVDVTVPSHRGLRVFELGADVQLEALDRIAGGRLGSKVVAVSACGALPLESDPIAAEDLESIMEGLQTAAARMQWHVDHARAIAEYLSCCDGLAGVWYPGLTSHPDHDLAARTLMHGFGPAVDFEMPDAWGVAAGELIARCQLSGRSCPAGGSHTRLHARDGVEGRAIRVFAGLDNPLEIAADLDRAMRSPRCA